MAVKQCVILNKNAGSAGQVERGLERLGPHKVFETAKPGDATRKARQAVEEGFDRVIAAGGDGTLNEVLNGLAAGFGKVQLGLIPLGTANDFAKAASIPTDIDQALSLIAEGSAKKVDVVRLTNCDERVRYFINVSAGGFSTLVSEKLDKQSKDWWGTLSYALSAVKALPELEQYEVQATFDDEEPHKLPVYNMVVANAGFVGGNIPVAPRARLDDGLFDVVIFRAVTLARLTTLVPKVLLGQHMDDEDVLFRQARRFQISSTPPFEFNADGEIVGACPALFEIVPGAIDVIVGPENTADTGTSRPQ